jgi:hypothetical protein
MTHEAAHPREDVLARKIREGDWEYAALVALLRLVDATHRLPPGSIDDVLALLSSEGEGKEHGHG